MFTIFCFCCALLFHLTNQEDLQFSIPQLVCIQPSSTCIVLPANVSIVNKDDIPMNVTELILSGNKFTNITALDLQGLTRLMILKVSDNLIDLVEDFSFKDQARLKTLKLDKNRITAINENTFFGLTELTNLDLHMNLISGTLPRGLFQHLTSLNMLNLTMNRITDLDDCVFCNITNVTEVNLSQNSITSISKGAFQGLNNLLHLDLSGNLLTTFDVSSLPLMIISLNTRDNNWTCTCSFNQEYRDFVFSADVLQSSQNCSDREDVCTQCSSPASLIGENLYYLSEANFSDCAATSGMTPITTMTTELTETSDFSETPNSNETTSQSTQESFTETTTTTTIIAHPQISIPLEKILLAALVPAGFILLIIIISFVYICCKSIRSQASEDNERMGSYDVSRSNTLEGVRTPDIPLAPMNVFENKETAEAINDEKSRS